MDSGGRSSSLTCVAGIGASAGGLDAMRDFFKAMKPHSGIAFVVVQQRDPASKKPAAGLLQQYTGMLVRQAEEGMHVEADHVYVTPPNQYFSITNGVLHSTVVKENPGRLPVDHFFHSLGEDMREKAVGIILSGDGSDGSLGLRTIVDKGGVILVQKPETAQFDSMPRNAVASGLVSYVLPVGKMPAALLDYAHTVFVSDAEQSEAGLADSIVKLVGSRHGYGFSGYKKNMLVRRIARRMRLMKVRSAADYLALLRNNSMEADALTKDFMITVTAFFRDPEAWKELERRVLVPLVKSRTDGAPIRVWATGAATGEEAYSLAMLLHEVCRQQNKVCPIQVFSTDSNTESLTFARAGMYPAGITEHVPAPLLRKYFKVVNGGQHYQVIQALRESVMFGVHNVLADPPFSNVDLISCRNLLIYFEPEVQQKLISTFNFALRPGGHLFLGGAETVGAREDLFRTISKSCRIYQKLGGLQRNRSSAQLVVSNASYAAAGGALPQSMASMEQAVSMVQQIINERFAPAAVLVDAKYEAQYFCGPTERYLSQPRGIPTRGVLALARDGLRSKLKSALRQAQSGTDPVAVTCARVKNGASFEPVKITVMPIAEVDGSKAHWLIVFQAALIADMHALGGSENILAQQLEEELKATKEDLQGTIERLEAANEDLQSENEEAVSINEELQSINEELESSKEELQSLSESMNEENQQLQVRVLEQESSASMLKNMLASSEIATLCLDRESRIQWFTPAMQNIFRLQQGDIGREIHDFAQTLSGYGLRQVTKEVLEGLVPVQTEVKTDDGKWLLRRILPCCGEDVQADGVVVTFADISAIKLKAEATFATNKSFTEELEQRVAERTSQLQALSFELAMAEERERRALAQDLHDNLGQLLAVAKIKLVSVLKKHPGGDGMSLLIDVQEMVSRANKSVHLLAFQLSPPLQGEAGLLPVFQWIAQEVHAVYGLDVHIQDDGLRKVVDQRANVIIFRAVRELLINVAKHANVSQATLSLFRKGEHIVITVHDDGHGIDFDAIVARPHDGGFGLVSMRERVNFIGGTVEIASYPGEGTTVTLRVPLPEADSMEVGK